MTTENFPPKRFMVTAKVRVIVTPTNANAEVAQVTCLQHLSTALNEAYGAANTEIIVEPAEEL